MIPIDPRFMSATSWTDQTIIVLADEAPIPRLLHEDKWRDWAAYVILTPAIAALGPAQPQNYRTWKEWADAFNETIRLLEG